MKKLFFVFGLTTLLFFTACKENSTAQEVTVISPEEVYNAVRDSGNLQLIDVRTKEEYGEDHLETAQNICVTDDDFREKVAKLNKDEPVYLYCRSGKRSAKAAQIMKEMGFKEIYDMEGGFLNWDSQGLQDKN
ncbi:rhodanese-like domain-containing protein [Aequorivita sp. F47161]|jgi:rhodanese-related sulfurtransferase|uniref:Rhodanese-like domain-containing protein n=1 Tax=Aequorivita vitellina TaxID=2874475 RepID=A0A9X1QVW1_9FLAO|nr:rhodanese-like domain-containing protein [Aequorivita vitellina]MCG2419280.1 rhodanese-like domain-containing protein [Aequorivita vitellina]MCZ4318883.1 rhodanese-like domain-containing protein [Aequorivita viscosa]